MKISEEVVFLKEAFDVLNERYFESALSRPAITIQSTPCGMVILLRMMLGITVKD